MITFLLVESGRMGFGGWRDTPLVGVSTGRDLFRTGVNDGLSFSFSVAVFALIRPEPPFLLPDSLEFTLDAIFFLVVAGFDPCGLVGVSVFLKARLAIVAAAAAAFFRLASAADESGAFFDFFVAALGVLAVSSAALGLLPPLF